MIKTCRFCREKTLVLLFSPTNRDSLKISEFACTNCGFGKHGTIVKCNNCGLIYVDERISQKQISTYYEVANDPLYFLEQPARQKTFLGYLKRLEKMMPKKGKILDVGTNTGLFVKLAKDDGWEAFGLEPNKWAVEYAKKNYDIDLINKPFKKNIFSKGSFDVISMWDVIEHFTDPISEIKKVIDYLRPGGMFVFSTTNPESPFAKIMGTRWPWYMEMHRVFLSSKTVQKHLENLGFNKIIFKPHFRSLSLGYLATRLQALSPLLAEVASRIVKILKVDKKIIPFYANDIYDCYAVK